MEDERVYGKSSWKMKKSNLKRLRWLVSYHIQSKSISLQFFLASLIECEFRHRLLKLKKAFTVSKCSINFKNSEALHLEEL